MISSIFVFVVLISLYIFWPSFSLGFGGDDYFGLLDYLRHLKPGELINWNFFLWHYGPQDTWFGFIHRMFGLNPTPFFVISFLLRILAAISLYPVIRLFTKSLIVVFLGILFFAVTFAGLETTSWGFNMFAYVAIGLLNLFFYNYVRFKRTTNLKFLFLSGAFFFLAIVFSPTRMTGLIPYVALFEIFWLVFLTRRVNSLTNSLLGMGLFATLIILILSIGNTLASGNSLSERMENLRSSTTADTSISIQKHLEMANYNILLNPIQQIGALIIPVKDITHHEYILQTPKRFFTLTFIGFSLIYFLIFNSLWKDYKKLIFASYTLSSIITYSAWFASFTPLKIIPFGTGALLYLSGSYFLIISFNYLLILSKTDSKKAQVFALGLIWMISSIFIFWNRFPESVNLTYHRYLISPIVGLTIVLTVIYSGIKKYKDLATILFICLIYSHATNTYDYLKNLESVRNKKLNTNIRLSLPNITRLSSSANPSHPLVFYFESNNKDILYHNVLFGFPTMVAINENLMYYPNLVYTDNWPEVVDDYQTGKSLKRFSWLQNPVPINNIFSFRLENDKLIDQSEEVRKRLK